MSVTRKRMQLEIIMLKDRASLRQASHVFFSFMNPRFYTNAQNCVFIYDIKAE